jgi:hypothetical protein
MSRRFSPILAYPSRTILGNTNKRVKVCVLEGRAEGNRQRVGSATVILGRKARHPDSDSSACRHGRDNDVSPTGVHRGRETSAPLTASAAKRAQRHLARVGERATVGIR